MLYTPFLSAVYASPALCSYQPDTPSSNEPNMGFATFFATFLLFVSGALAGMSLSNASAGLHLTSRGFYETSSMIWPLATTVRSFSTKHVADN